MSEPRPQPDPQKGRPADDPPAKRFGGRTRTTWPAKWRSGPGVPVRFPRDLHDGLTALARAADEASDPALALAEMLALWRRRNGGASD